MLPAIVMILTAYCVPRLVWEIANSLPDKTADNYRVASSIAIALSIIGILVIGWQCYEVLHSATSPRELLGRP